MEKMKARIKYEENFNGKEGYAVEIFSEGEWGLSTFYPLVKREGAEETDEKNFIHFSFINKLAELNELGYKISFM